MPKSDKKMGDRFNTLNGMGLMINFIDLFTQDFLSQARIANTVNLDIGTAYGNTAIAALKSGCQDFIANDMDIRHLGILAKRITKLGIKFSNRIRYMPGRYPNDFKIKSESIDSILISRVLHFLSPKEIIEVVKDMYRILKTGGKAFVICNSPYNQSYIHFLPIYKLAKKKGEKYPGYVKQRKKYVNNKIFDQESINKLYAGQFTYFDLNTFQDFFSNKYFEIERADYFAYEKNSLLSFDGRETVGAIIRKR